MEVMKDYGTARNPIFPVYVLVTTKSKSTLESELQAGKREAARAKATNEHNSPLPVTNQFILLLISPLSGAPRSTKIQGVSKIEIV